MHNEDQITRRVKPYPAVPPDPPELPIEMLPSWRDRVAQVGYWVGIAIWSILAGVGAVVFYWNATQ